MHVMYRKIQGKNQKRKRDKTDAHICNLFHSDIGSIEFPIGKILILFIGFKHLSNALPTLK